MRHKVEIITIGIAALVLAGAPVYAQTSTTDKQTSTTDKMKEKANEAGAKIKDTANEAGTKMKETANEAGTKMKDTAHDAKVGMSDSWVTSKAKIALFADERVKGRQVHVETKNGVVALRGKVDSAEAKAAAADIAAGIEGAKSVKNELQVVPPSQRDQVAANDKEITKSVEQRLKQDPQLKKIDARVDSGVVVLTGEVPSIDASAKASEVARNIPGVRYVKNDLTYASRSSLK
jgi:hyperosmotically inducible protein